MKIIFLISDDYVWAPRVLNHFLQKSKHQVVAIAGIPGILNRSCFFTFVLTYLNLLYPLLFLTRAIQSLGYRFAAFVFGSRTSVKRVAEFFKVPYQRFYNINSVEAIKWLKEFSPDIMISIQTQFIQKELTQIVLKGIINIHPAKLPAYRGPAPIFWVLYHQEKETAVTAHFINEKFDDGSIIAQETIPIAENESYMSLGEKITKAMPQLLFKAIEKVEEGTPGFPNIAFPGCYQSYPSMKQAFLFHTGPIRRLFK